MYSRKNPPKPWRDEHDVSRIENHLDYQEPFGRDMWPQNGFIDDFIMHTYGRETTNLFAFWTAIAGLSGIIQRDCHLKFGPQEMFANFYIVLVAPPGLCHKSTGMIAYDGIERDAMATIQNTDLLTEKKYSPVKGKVTAEALFDTMANVEYENMAGEKRITSAKMVARISELTTMLSKATYNAQLVDKLTDFYDCNTIDTDITRGGGAKTLHNIYASMFAATTPDHLKHSIPEEAFGGGFMSRAIIVNQDISGMKRIIPLPFVPPECPDREELSARLAWLIRTKHGEYKLSPDAYRYYEEWYRDEILELRKLASMGDTDNRNNRKYVHTLKLALILAIQRYDNSTVITLEDFKMAVRIIEYTFRTATDTVDEIYLSSVVDGDFKKLLKVIKSAGDNGVSKIALARTHNFKRQEIDHYIEELKFRKLIEARRVETGTRGDGKPKKSVLFFYIGDQTLDFED